jgi:hypothetical protein
MTSDNESIRHEKYQIDFLRESSVCLVAHSFIHHNLVHGVACTTGNAATVAVAHSTKKTSGKDSVIEGQPLLLFM